MIRLVLDPGVLISALISPSGTPARLLDMARDGRIDLVTSPALVKELRTVLTRPKLRRYVTAAQVDRFIGFLRRLSIEIDDPANRPRVCRDADDDYLIALARAANAVALVSGDKDLTTLSQPTLIVLTPRHALTRLERTHRRQ